MNQEDPVSQDARESIQERRTKRLFARGCLSVFLAVVLLMMVCTVCVVATLAVRKSEGAGLLPPLRNQSTGTPTPPAPRRRRERPAGTVGPEDVPVGQSTTWAPGDPGTTEPRPSHGDRRL